MATILQAVRPSPFDLSVINALYIYNLHKKVCDSLICTKGLSFYLAWCYLPIFLSISNHAEPDPTIPRKDSQPTDPVSPPWNSRAQQFIQIITVCDPGKVHGESVLIWQFLMSSDQDLDKQLQE